MHVGKRTGQQAKARDSSQNDPIISQFSRFDNEGGGRFVVFYVVPFCIINRGYRVACIIPVLELRNNKYLVLDRYIGGRFYDPMRYI